ncbi:MAG: FUSC family protein [Eubacterium ramulus]
MKRSEKQKNLMRSAIAPTIVATIIFFITYFFFGMENTMIGPFATLSFLRYRNMCNHYECLIRNFIVYMIMAVFSFLAVINLPLCILIDAAALFWLAYLLIDEYNPNNYFPAGMDMIFFPDCTSAYLFSTWKSFTCPAGKLRHCIFIFLASFRKENAQKRLIGLIQEGFEVCRQLLDLTAKDGDASSFAENVNELLPVHKKLCEINQKCSMEIYSSNRAALRHKGKINWYCRFVLVFQVINYLTNHPEQEGNMARAEEIYAKFYPQFLTTEPTADYRKLTFRVRKPDIRNMRLRFALRQVIILTPCLVISYLWQSNNIYWLVISVFFMMIPFTEHTVERVRQRVLGTMAGIVLCFVFFTLFPDFGSRVVIMTVANFMIYAADGYGPMVAFITCSALALQSIDSSVPIVLLQRLFYTLAGAGIALLANKYIFPVRIQKQMQYLFELLKSIRTKLTEVDAHTTPGEDVRRHQIDQLIIKSYLLSTRAENLQDSLPKEKKLPDFENDRKQHMAWLASYLVKYLFV